MQHKLFPYTEQEKEAVVKNLGLSEDGLKEDVDAIMDWFQKQPHLVEAGIGEQLTLLTPWAPIADPDVVRTFLLMTKGSREKVKRRIDHYYKYRALVPEVIEGRMETLSSSREIWTCFHYAAILKLYEGRRVTFVQILDSEFSTVELFRNIYMMNDLRVKYDCFRGDIWVVDLKNATLGQLLRLNPLLAQRSAQIFQDGLGFRVHSIHVLNFPSIGHQIVNLFRKFVKAKIMDRVIIHDSVEELHKVLPKSYVPKDYGGKGYSMQEYKDIYEKDLRSEQTKQFLINACKHVSNENKRPDDYIDAECVAGTFKKLNLD